MRRQTRFISLIACSLGIMALGLPLAADDTDTGHAFNRIPLKGRAELSTMLSDPRVAVQQKTMAINRLVELRKDLASSPDKVPASELYNPIRGMLTHDQAVLRRSACAALQEFADEPGAEALVKPLGTILNNQSETNEVRIAAATSLGRFTKHRIAAADELARALNDLVAQGARGDNVVLTASVVNGLGRLRDKRSFVPLNRVIRSNFPTSVKEAAQKALENIDWD